jgi:DNA-binding IclR family transcriptional regulator
MTSAYHLAQQAIADLKSAIHQLLSEAGETGLTNAEIGRTLGIYTGHVGHEGHIPRTLLAVMEAEGVVSQDTQAKRWCIRKHGEAAPE